MEKQKVVIDQLKNKLQVEDFEHLDKLRSALFVHMISLKLDFLQLVGLLLMLSTVGCPCC